VSEDGAYLEQIESDEIKKLVELIYGSKPEDVIEITADIPIYIIYIHKLEIFFPI